jgi:hypothetical protein
MAGGSHRSGSFGRRRDPLRLTDVRFTAAPVDLVETGLLGWITAVIGGVLRVQGLALRRTASGRLTISYPTRTDRNGLEHPFLAPVDDEARRHVEDQILAALGHCEEAAG